MKANFISSAGLMIESRRTIAAAQIEVSRQQSQLVTGRLADVGLEKGVGAGGAVALRREQERFALFMETNHLADLRLTASQDALEGLGETAQSFLATLVAVRGGGNGAGVAQQSARSALESMAGLMNTTVRGQHVFAGTNSDTAPLAAYFSQPASAAKAATDAQFQAAFGVPQGDPATGSIDPVAMQAFLDGPFAANFEGPAWANNWSTAFSDNLVSRTSPSTTLVTSVNANEAAFRQLAAAYTMIGDLGVESLGEPAFQAVVDTAIEKVALAIDGIGKIRSGLGVTQERLAQQQERLDVQLDVLETELHHVEGIDPYETSSRISLLLTQIEVSYALTARLSALSLARYL